MTRLSPADHTDRDYAPASETKSTSSRRTRNILLGLVLGALSGMFAHALSPWMSAAATTAGTFLTGLFLRLIRLIIAPLVFATLVSGIGSLGDGRQVLRIGTRAIAWFMAASLVSLFTGMMVADLLQPGRGFPRSETAPPAGLAVSFDALGFLLHVVPTSIFDAMARNDILQIVVFSILFALALPAAGATQSRLILPWMDEIARIMLRMTEMIMAVAPLAVFGSALGSFARDGAAVLWTYALFGMDFLAALVLLWLLLFGATCVVLGRGTVPLARALVQPILLGFSTASSEAAFPLLVEKLEECGVPPRISGFILPLGYSFNLDGSMLFQSFGALFIAQAYGIHLAAGAQVAMLLIMMISSKGIAGVPRAALVTLAAVMPQFGLPEAGLALLLGIDHFADMARTATNVLGNGFAAAIAAKWENVIEPEQTFRG